MSAPPIGRIILRLPAGERAERSSWRAARRGKGRGYSGAAGATAEMGRVCHAGGVPSLASEVSTNRINGEGGAESAVTVSHARAAVAGQARRSAYRPAIGGHARSRRPEGLSNSV